MVGIDGRGQKFCLRVSDKADWNWEIKRIGVDEDRLEKLFYLWDRHK